MVIDIVKELILIMSNIHSPKFDKYYEDVKKYYSEGKTNKEIVNLLNCSEITNPRQISKIAYTLGITKRKINTKNKEKFKEKDEKAIELIKQGLSCTEVAKMLNIDQQSMNFRLKKYYDFTVLSDGKKEVNGHFFDKIDTEEKAYWLGFFYADGYVGKNNEVELCLCERDKQHVAKFKGHIKSKHSIARKKICLKGKVFYAYRISIKDTDLANGLKKHGCMNNKSYRIEMPQLKSKDLYRHFIRGFFDGDGAIMRKKDYVCISITSASESFCNSLVSYCDEIIGIKLFKKEYTNENVFDLRTMARNEGIIFLHHLYDDCSIYLDRKYDQYQRICRSEMISLKSLNDKDGIKRGWRNVD